MASQRRTPLRFGNARFTVFAPNVVRMEYSPEGRFAGHPPVVLAETLPPARQANATERGKKLTITTDDITLTFRDDGKPFHADNLAVEHPGLHGGRRTWRPGQAEDPLCTHVRSMDDWPHMATKMDRESHPGLFDRSGGRAIALPKVVHDPKTGWVSVPEDGAPQARDILFFGHGSDLAGALGMFVRLFGPIPLVPRWVFGFWYSRWYEYTQDDILAIAKRYRAKGLPMDVMVVDTEWREKGWWGYDWDPGRFPRPRAFLKELKKMGLRVPLNDHPGYGDYDPLPGGDKAIPVLKKELGEPPVKGRWACDWSRRSVVDAWKRHVLGKAFRDGMDFWWIDGWIQSPFGGVKGQFWANRHYFELAEEETDERGLVLSRWGGWGSHRYPVQFSGDTQSDWTTLREQIDYTAAAGDAGAAYWSHDIGGFFTPKIDEDLYIRWVQFGAFSPIFRTHSAFGTREPFEYTKRALRAFKHAVRWRYAMAPYWYHLAREAHETGLPLCRPCYLHWPTYRTAYAYRDQYLVGPDVLVAPAYRNGERVGRPLWVPPGEWIRPETGEVFAGQDTRDIRFGLEEIPVYYRRGAIVPHQEPAETTHAKKLDPLWLDIYPDPNEPGELDLYEDDGISREHADGAFSRTRIRCRQTDRRIVVTVDPPRGAYRGQPKRRTVVLNIWIAPDERVKEVAVDGETLPKSGWKQKRDYAAGVCKAACAFLRVEVTQAKATVRAEVRYH